jgi:hypothetical protein
LPLSCNVEGKNLLPLDKKLVVVASQLGVILNDSFEAIKKELALKRSDFLGLEIEWHELFRELLGFENSKGLPIGEKGNNVVFPVFFCVIEEIVQTNWER